MVGEVVPMGGIFKKNKYKSKQQIVFESYTNIFACKNQTRAIQKQERGNHKFAKFEHPTNL